MFVFFSGSLDPCPDPLSRYLPFEFCKGTHNTEEELSLRSISVEVHVRAYQPYLMILKFGKELEEVLEAPSETIQFPYNDSVEVRHPHILEHQIKLGP